MLRRLRLGLKWGLAALGLFLCINLAILERQERRIGLGSGVVFALVTGTIKGLLTRSRDRGRQPNTQSL
jgi:hypothetical protein